MNQKNTNNIFGYFGKLPQYTDFIKYNAGTNEISTFDKWIQDGLVITGNKLKSLWKEIYKKSSSYNFFYPFTGTDNFLAGKIFPGGDKNEREFPFIMFVNENKKYLNIPPHLVPLRFSGIMEYFEDISGNFDKDIFPANKDEMNAHLGFPSEKLANDFYLYLNGMQKDFWERTVTEFKAQQKYVLISNLIQQLDWLRNNPIPSHFNGIKISFVSTKECNGYDSGFFIKLILALINKNSYIPAIFWCTKENQSTLFIFFNKPDPQHFMDLIFEEENADRILNVNNINAESIAASPNRYLSKILDDDKLTLKELLNLLTLSKSAE